MTAGNHPDVRFNPFNPGLIQQVYAWKCEIMEQGGSRLPFCQQVQNQ